MNLPSHKPRFAVLPAMMFAVGLGLLLYYGDLWWRLPSYTTTDIEQSAELNLMLDLQRRGPEAAAALTEAQLLALREGLITEVNGEVTRERRDIQRGFATGAALTAVSLAQLIWLRRSSRRDMAGERPQA